MPIYEYRCEECDERFEVMVRSSAQQAAPNCPKCGSGSVKRAISLFGVGGTGSGGASDASCQIGST